MVRPGDIHTVAVSHGEGRFAATEAEAKRLLDSGQIASQYVITSYSIHYTKLYDSLSLVFKTSNSNSTVSNI